MNATVSRDKTKIGDILTKTLTLFCYRANLEWFQSEFLIRLRIEYNFSTCFSLSHWIIKWWILVFFVNETFEFFAQTLWKINLCPRGFWEQRIRVKCIEKEQHGVDSQWQGKSWVHISTNSENRKNHQKLFWKTIQKLVYHLLLHWKYLNTTACANSHLCGFAPKT